VDTAAALFLISLFTPPAAVTIGIVIALWLAGLRVHREGARPVAQPAAQH
jgi:hypothetical protein